MPATPDEYRVIDEATTISAVALIGWPRDAGVAPSTVRDAARATLQRWVAEGLPFQGRAGQRFFDPFEVINHARDAGMDGRDPLFVEQTIPAWREFVRARMDVDHRPHLEGLHDPARLTVILRREFHMRDRPRLARLRVPLPYPDPAQTGIHVEVVHPHTSRATSCQWPGRLEVRWPDPPDVAVVEVQVTLTAWQQSFDLEQADDRLCEITPEVEPYLRSREGMIHITPFVRDLAERLVGNLRSPAAMLRAFWNHFFTGPRFGPVHHERFQTGDPLESMVRRGRYDCLGASALLVSLCRVKGIPARLIHGIIPHDRTPVFHFWAEVWLPPLGWVPADLASWDLALGRADAEPWPQLFLGRMEHRVKCECYPHTIVGPIGIPFPPRWTQVLTATAAGTRATYLGIDPTRTLFRDELSVRLSNLTQGGVEGSPPSGGT